MAQCGQCPAAGELSADVGAGRRRGEERARGPRPGSVRGPAANINQSNGARAQLAVHNLTFVIDGATYPDPLASDRGNHFIKMPIGGKAELCDTLGWLQSWGRTSMSSNVPFHRRRRTRDARASLSRHGPVGNWCAGVLSVVSSYCKTGWRTVFVSAGGGRSPRSGELRGLTGPDTCSRFCRMPRRSR
jgi:hypothetical protein